MKAERLQQYSFEERLSKVGLPVTMQMEQHMLPKGMMQVVTQAPTRLTGMTDLGQLQSDGLSRLEAQLRMAAAASS